MANYFKGLKVVELASVLAGPAVGLFFAELGAEVIKIENKRTSGDVTRKWKLPSENPDENISAYFFSVNWGKEHLFLDLREKEDLEKVLDLIREADIVISNFKAGSAKKLGLDYAALQKINSRLIYASISAYGKNDPRPGFDVAMQAETGWIYMTGEADGQPCKLPVALIDILSAHQLKEGVLVALLERMKTGKGSEVTVSLFDSSIASLANQASNYLNLGHVPQRMGSLHPNIAPYGEIVYSKDQKPLMISTGTEAHFRLLCKCLGIPELSIDERFNSNEKRLGNRKALGGYLSKAFSEFESEFILEKMNEYGVPVVPIKNLEEVFAQPETEGLLLENNHEGRIYKSVKTAIFKINSNN